MILDDNGNLYVIDRGRVIRYRLKGKRYEMPDFTGGRMIVDLIRDGSVIYAALDVACKERVPLPPVSETSPKT